MIALFFEVTPRSGEEGRYLEIAASLKCELDQSGGVVFLDRFRSLVRPQTMLSHQIWWDEGSLARWRANARHNGAQRSGRGAVFEDYRLRVGAVVAHVGEANVGEAHAGEARAIVETAPGIAYNDPARQAERYIVVVRSTTSPFSGRGAKAVEAWRSVYNETSYAWTGSVENREQGLIVLAEAAREPCVSAAQLCLVSRDYGMFDRGEAPQYFPESKTV